MHRGLVTPPCFPHLQAYFRFVSKVCYVVNSGSFILKVPSSDLVKFQNRLLNSKAGISKNVNSGSDSGFIHFLFRVSEFPSTFFLSKEGSITLYFY